MSNKVYGYITKLILERLEAGTVPWRKAWSGGGQPMSGGTRRPYRGVNRLVLGMAPFSSPLWLTARQIEAAGGRIREGESYWPVLFWRWTDPREEDRRPFPISRYYRVWNVEQCEGLGAEFQAAAPERSFTPVEAAEKIIRDFEDGPKIVHGKSACFYDARQDLVGMPHPTDFEPAEEYYAAIFHELGHATGHASRLHRPEVGASVFGGESYSREELVAELTAAFLCGTTGLAPKTIDNSAAYIEGWRAQLGRDPKMLITAAQWAQKAADWIQNIRGAEDGQGDTAVAA